MEFDKYSHSLGESNFHFQFKPKYQRDVFRDVIIKKACEESFLRIAVKYKMVVRALELLFFLLRILYKFLLISYTTIPLSGDNP